MQTALGCLTGFARRGFREVQDRVADGDLCQMGNDFAAFAMTD